MIATSIEQSKKLEELGIDPSTADMSWYRPNVIYPYELHTKYKGHGVMVDGSDDLIPAWSLSALLELIPTPTLGRIDEEKFWYCNTIRFGDNYFSYDGGYHSNPLDAVIEVLEWLKKHKHI